MREMTVAEYYQMIANMKFVGDSTYAITYGPKIILTDIEDYL